jgi:glyoxylate/hydroxypyruvate reductase
MFFVSTPWNSAEWVRAFRAALPASLPVVDSLDGLDPAAIRYFAGWRPKPELLASLTGLRAMFALAAGVDGLLAAKSVPDHVPLMRILDGGMAPQMSEFCLYGVLRFHRQFDLYEAQQATQTWASQPGRAAAETRVSVLGMGTLGSAVAKTISGLGYPVRGWSRSGGTVDGIACESGRDGLLRLLAETDIAIVLLPLTPDTERFIDASALAALPDGAALINVARGGLIDEDALLAALNSGRLRGVLLDVTATEPLPADHPLWTHPRVRITPHVAASTLIGPAVAQIVANVDRIERGEAPTGVVDRQRGY